MIVNTTFYVEPALKSEFEGWASDCYVAAAVKSTGYVSSMVMRLLVEIEAGAGYAVQLRFADDDAARHWDNAVAPELLSAAAKRWGERMVHFTTFMEELV